ncbi:MAG TPA: hypothetical protein VEK08_23000 [Planctomycetota bacterium]|nr:hypothetical protein [Planctomycetota bacterium]
MSVRIEFSKLQPSGFEDVISWDEAARYGDFHIHGYLRIEFNDRPVPGLGHFSEEDVCFDFWTHELSRVVQQLSLFPVGSYTVDEGEQGHSAYSFARNQQYLSLSVVSSEIGEGPSNPNYQQVTVKFEDFIKEVEQFFQRLREELNKLHSGAYEKWEGKHNIKPFIVS